MRYRFTKELINDQHTQTDNPRKQLRLYTVLDPSGGIAGQLYCYPAEQFLKTGQGELEIKTIKHLWKSPEYLLLQPGTDQPVGECLIHQVGINYFWQDVPSSPNGSIRLQDQVYNFRRVSPGISYSPFNRKTWGHYKFLLYALKGEEQAEYTFKMDIPVWSKPHFTNFRPFEGTIDTNSGNLPALVAAIFLMEFEFVDEDERSSG